MERYLPEAILTDLDNSILNSDRHVSEKDRHTIRILEEHGVKVFVVTGRHHRFAKDAASEIGFEYPVCANNGMHILDYRTERTFFLHNPIDSDLVKAMVTFFSKKGYHFAVYTEKNGYFNNEQSRHKAHWEKQRMDWKPENRFEFHFLTDEDADLDCLKVLTLYLTCPSEEEKAEIERRFNPNQELTIFWSGEGCLDICPKGVDKGFGARKLAELFDFSLENTMALGDNYNDLAMLKVCGISIAPENAEEEIKSICSYVTTHHDDSPLTHAIMALYSDFFNQYLL